MFRRKASRNKVLHFDPGNLSGASVRSGATNTSRSSSSSTATAGRKYSVSEVSAADSTDNLSPPASGRSGGGTGASGLPARDATAAPLRPTFADRTNRHSVGGAPRASNGWLAGPLSRSRLKDLTASPASKMNTVKAFDDPCDTPAGLLVDHFPGRRMPSGLTPTQKRQPKVDRDGVLIFSDDDSENSFMASPVPPRRTRHSMPGGSPRRARVLVDVSRPAPISPTPAQLPAGVRRAKARVLCRPEESDEGGEDDAGNDHVARALSSLATSSAASLTTPKAAAGASADGDGDGDGDGKNVDADGEAHPSMRLVGTVPSARPQPFHRCIVVRKNRGKHKFLPRFLMFVEHEGITTPELLLMARKKNLTKNSSYLLFDMRNADPKVDMKVDSGRYLGKLVTMDRGTTFVFRGKNVAKPTDKGTDLCAVHFKTPSLMRKLRSHVGPRTATVVLPSPRPDGAVEDCGNLAERVVNKRLDGLTVMNTKKPSVINGVYQLNFGGRVKVASIKNFQMVHPLDKDDIRIQFGKVSGDSFILDFRAPLSACQALSIALAQFLV